MTLKARQLFLELYLLRLRYTDSEIELVSNVSEAMNDPELKNLLLALGQFQVSVPSASQHKKAIKRTSKTSALYPRNDRVGIQKAINYFVDRLANRRILPAEEELDRFTQTIGVRESFGDRREMARAIKRVLESMPPTLALEMMRGVDNKSKSDSGPYVNLAKTLMRT